MKNKKNIGDVLGMTSLESTIISSMDSGVITIACREIMGGDWVVGIKNFKNDEKIEVMVTSSSLKLHRYHKERRVTWLIKKAIGYMDQTR